jgi:hypothetical protein
LLIFELKLEATMFALLIGAGALFLAVFVSAILDPRWSRAGGAGEAESGYVVDDTLRQRAAWWGSLIASRPFAVTSSFVWQAV